MTKTSYGTRRKYALGESLDSVMNYPFRSALLDFLTFRSDSRALADFLLGQRLNYPPPLYFSLMNLISSHDVERARTALATRLDARSMTREQQAGFIVAPAQDERGASMQRLAAAMQFAVPGVPSVYYGDETGMNGLLDPFDRAPFCQRRAPADRLVRRPGRGAQRQRRTQRGRRRLLRPGPGRAHRPPRCLRRQGRVRPGRGGRRIPGGDKPLRL